MKYLILIAILMTSLSSFASSKYAVGTGYQYGGVIGAKYSFHIDDNKVISVSASPILGVAMGYQQSLDKMSVHALGLSAGFEEFTADDGFVVMTYNYYPDGFQNSGWTLGIDAGIRNTGSKSFLGYKTDRSIYPALFINLGYQF